MHGNNPFPETRWVQLKGAAPILTTMLALAAAWACSDTSTLPTDIPDSVAAASSFQVPSDACGDATEVLLLAGQTMEVGTVTVWNDGDAIHVAFSATGGWSITATHIAIVSDVAEFPTNRPGNPQVGLFPWGDDFDPGVPEAVYSVSLEDLGVDPGDIVYVAAHAVVVNALDETETAWADGTRFVQRGNWATYLEYEIETCGAGEDIVVFNDINIFDNNGMNGGVGNPNNHIMVSNLVNFTTSGPRGTGTVVWWDLGRNSVCGGQGYCTPSAFGTMSSVITGLGYTINVQTSSSGSITSIPANVKVIFLWNPLVAYTNDEINTLKAFASEGGRIVFIGEHSGYYGAGIPVENDFLLKMGAVMTNVGQAVDCGYVNLPGTSLRPHQVTIGMTAVRIACASVIVPGPDDYALFYDSSNTLVLAGVAQIDPTPLSPGMVIQSNEYVAPTVNTELPAGLIRRSSTGR